MTLRFRIFLNYSIIIFLASLFVTIMAILYFNDKNTQFHRDELATKEKSVMLSLHDLFFDENIEITPKNIQHLLKIRIHTLKQIHDLDLNIFDLKGRLLVTSVTSSSSKRGRGPRIPKKILNQLVKTRSIVYMDESIETVYMPTYSYIYSRVGKPVAILHIPYGYKHSEAQKETIGFLFYLLPWFLGLLVVSLIITFLLSRYITDSLAKVGEQMKKNHAEGTFEPILWNRKDEVGLLIETFNNMQQKMKESVALLSTRKKEEAWQEMAKQIAHEIKNPLTPMRLSIQQFQYTYDPKSPDSTKKLNDLTQMLVAQIDLMTNIADSFASFAKMPTPKNRRLNLIVELELIRQLFIKREVNVKSNVSEAWMMMDKDIFHRICINLIKNSVQARNEEEDDKFKVDIFLNLIDKKINLEFKDNGVGIEKETLMKIFEPRFTTKSTGTGIGLAMVKKMVEYYQGKIEVESHLGKGTTFLLSFPIN